MNVTSEIEKTKKRFFSPQFKSGLFAEHKHLRSSSRNHKQRDHLPTGSPTHLAVKLNPCPAPTSSPPRCCCCSTLFEAAQGWIETASSWCLGRVAYCSASCRYFLTDMCASLLWSILFASQLILPLVFSSSLLYCIPCRGFRQTTLNV